MYHQATTNTPGNPSVQKSSQRKLNDRRNGGPLRVLSEEEWQFWINNGYVIIRNAVPDGHIHDTVNMLWWFTDKDPHDPDSWYGDPFNEMEMVELKKSGMIEVYHHQALWNNRQYPKIYDAFVDIWGTEKLWVTIDRANLNIPNREDHQFKGFIHWDIDTSLVPLPVNVQGVLSLNDTTEEMGGFQCVPELFRKFDEWVKTQPEDRDPWKPDLTGFEIEKVQTKAGDLLIWNSLLPHGIRPNRSNHPRLAQYISMSPAEEENEEMRQWRINSWKKREAPTGYPFPGDPRQWEKKYQKPARLTELGKKLLGLESWS